MKRRYRAKGFLERIRRIRAVLDRPAFSTDVIVGFPGESDADFADTCRVVREAGFSRIHVFSYSPRAGTASFALRDNVPPSVKARRRQQLHEIESEQLAAYQRSLLGRVLDVLVEGADPDRPGFARGTSCRYASVSFPGHAPALLRRRVPVRVLAITNSVLVGEPEPGGMAASRSDLTPRRLPLPVLG
jgi:threonylcarbamoyladenosine tRNA methylthiotransferase MtaB